MRVYLSHDDTESILTVISSHSIGQSETMADTISWMGQILTCYSIAQIWILNLKSWTLSPLQKSSILMSHFE